MFLRKKRSGPRTYLQVVENRWEDGKSRQRVVATLGRWSALTETGALQGILRSGARMVEGVMLLEAVGRGEAPTVSTRRIGPALVFERLWLETGCRGVIEHLAGERRFAFALERAIFLTVLHRLICSGSDRAAEKWRDDYLIDGVEGLDLHHLYRAMAWLGEELPESQQDGRTPFAPRCTKDRVEEGLFLQTRDLFTELDLVFFDTTSIYFEGEGGESIGQRGHSKDHRPDLKQMVVAVIIDTAGRPICCELWPGNTADMSTLVPVVDRVCIVADRGLISKATVENLEARGFEYILGARMRAQREVRDEVLSRAGRYREVVPSAVGSRSPSALKVKEVRVEERRYVVCLNEDRAAKEKAEREAIVESLSRALKRGAKSLVGNKGYRRYLASDGGAFTIDEAKVKREARFDGKWVLRTNTDLDASEVALRYKQLWMVEALFRDTKSVLETRPIFHKSDQAIRGHAGTRPHQH